MKNLEEKFFWTYLCYINYAAFVSNLSKIENKKIEQLRNR